MSVYSYGVPTPSCTINTVDGTTTTTTVVAKGNTVTATFLNASNVEQSVSGVVVALIVGNAPGTKGSDQIIDGIPTYRFDPTGDAYYGSVDERFAATHLIVKETSESGKVSIVTVPVPRIQSITASETPAAPEGGSDTPPAEPQQEET